MLFDWFNAGEAIAVGTKLADYFMPAERLAEPKRRSPIPADDWRKGVPRFRKLVVEEVGRLRLNLFKRARLLNSFKWRLLEHGMDRLAADELTQLILMQLCANGGASDAFLEMRTAKDGKSLRRIPALVADADARFAARKYSEAAKRLQEVLALDSRNADACAKLGAVLCCLGRYAEAEETLRRAVEKKSTSGAAHLTLGNLLRDKGQFAASETALRRAVKQEPRNAIALASLGLTLGMRNRLGEARTCFERALRLKPRDPSVLCSVGWLAGIEGSFEEAERLYRATLKIDSRHPGAWALLAGLRRMTEMDRDWLDGVERTVEGGVPPLEESKLRYAMGKYFDDIGRYSRAFEQYKRANDLQKLVSSPYARAERSKFVDDMMGLYTLSLVAERAKGASESEKPVFVTGMMRSGTSLVEQIIASHGQAIGAGELDFWNTAARKHQGRLRQELPDEALTRELSGSYLKVVGRFSSTALRVVDKSTFNSDHLGLIHAVFPRARMVYVHRDPVDTCLSCYFQDFANVASFTMDLSDLAHYYREHHRLMSHWRTTLPQGALLIVPYAELVADPDAWSRKIIEFIGLEWDSRCLDFHKTKRAVLTASNWQVRQPMYSRSVGRWRNYGKLIGPLLQLQGLELA